MLSDWHLFWWFSMQQSPLNGMVGGSHRVRWFADGFWVFLHIWWFLMVVQHRSNDVMVTSSQCDYAFVQAGSLTTSENSHRRKDVQMQPMRLCMCSCRQFEKTFENSLWRKIVKMQPMQLCICSLRRFEKTFENSHWKKVVQMQPMRLCICFGRQFEKTF